MTRRAKIITGVIAVTGIVAVACYLFSGPSAEQLLGTSLPPDAHVLHIADRAGVSFGGDYYLQIEMSEADFRQLIAKLGMAHRPDLLEYWSSALHAVNDVEWWNVSQVNDENTMFGDKRQSTYLVARYEGGRMYFKVHVY